MGRDWRLLWHIHWRKCELDVPSLPISQFLPIRRSSYVVRRGARRSRGCTARVSTRAATPIATTASRATSGSPTSPGPCPELRGSPPAPAVGARRGGQHRQRQDEPRRPPRIAEAAAAAGPEPGHHVDAAISAQPSPIATSAAPAIRRCRRGRRLGRPAFGQDPHARRRDPSSRGSAGGPGPADIRGRPGRVERRARRRRWRARPTTPARSAAGPASPGRSRRGTRSGTSAAVPSDSRTTTTSPSSSAASSTAIESRPSRTSNGTRSRRSSRSAQPDAVPELQPRPPEDEGPVGVVLEVGLGVHPPGDLDVARRAGGEGLRLGDRHDRRGRQQQPDPIARPERPADHEPDGEHDETGDQGDQGRHGGDDTRPTLPGMEGPEGTVPTHGR